MKLCFVLLAAIISIGFIDFSQLPQIAPATCQVFGQAGSGSGILLETGYVLTSAHVLDINQNGLIDESEKHIELHFSDPNIFSLDKKIFTGQVVKHAADIDVAIIKPSANNLKSDIKLISDQDYFKLKFGDPVFTVGYQLGMQMHRTNGTISFPIDPNHERTSITILPGNSGGGVFNSKNECLGIAKASMTEEQRIAIPILNSITMIRFRQFIPNMSAYVPAFKIRAWAQSQNLSDFIDLPSKPIDIRPLAYLIIGLIVVLCGQQFRRAFAG